MANGNEQIPDFGDDRESQINLEEYELWTLQVELNRINEYMEELAKGIENEWYQMGSITWR